MFVTKRNLIRQSSFISISQIWNALTKYVGNALKTNMKDLKGITNNTTDNYEKGNLLEIISTVYFYWNNVEIQLNIF